MVYLKDNVKGELGDTEVVDTGVLEEEPELHKCV